eukprot:TRINITY_DN11062_c0_g1_i1.p1 TRINITY_DN11062_c0_g1~~TRINITY_DN11062_c0_g1_i1.p1  ORF type:complete len:253 (+),score=48.99 TRINITY_DN11062_c0_g1_i1:98-760(+)
MPHHVGFKELTRKLHGKPGVLELSCHLTGARDFSKRLLVKGTGEELWGAVKIAVAEVNRRHGVKLRCAKKAASADPRRDIRDSENDVFMLQLAVEKGTDFKYEDWRLMATAFQRKAALENIVTTRFRCSPTPSPPAEAITTLYTLYVRASPPRLATEIVERKLLDGDRLQLTCGKYGFLSTIQKSRKKGLYGEQLSPCPFREPCPGTEHVAITAVSVSSG